MKYFGCNYFLSAFRQKKIAHRTGIMGKDIPTNKNVAFLFIDGSVKILKHSSNETKTKKEAMMAAIVNLFMIFLFYKLMLRTSDPEGVKL
jgi:hypothetical protein